MHCKVPLPPAAWLMKEQPCISMEAATCNYPSAQRTFSVMEVPAEPVRPMS
jgi:hypothetical protein